MKPGITFALFLLAVSPALAGIEVIETEAAILVKADGARVLQYHKAVREPPAGMKSHYRRSGYIHPVWTPKGREVTGDFPADHPHQHALFFAWRKTQIEGRKVDFWNQAAELGRIWHEKVIAVQSGEDAGFFTVQLMHDDLTAPKGPKPVLRETWTVRVYRTAGDHFLFDLEQRQVNVTGAALILEKYRYGGLALRGPAAWLNTEGADEYKAWQKAANTGNPAPLPTAPRRGDFLTSEGKSWHNGNHTHARWVDLFGGTGDEVAGTAVLCHPENFRAPQAVRLHPTKPYFCFAPMVDGEFKIKPGEDHAYTARYRYFVHDGAPDAAVIDKAWETFAESGGKRSVVSEKTRETTERFPPGG